MDELHPRRRSHRPDRLAKRTCLARSTIYEVLKRAVSSGWILEGRESATGKRVWKPVCPEGEDRRIVMIPVNLIRVSNRVRPQEILCYGLLQALPAFRGRAGEFKWAEIRKLSGLDLRTIRRAVRRLAELRWISLAPKNRVSPIFYRMQDADQAYQEEVERRIDRATVNRSTSVGEALMREYLSLIVETNASEDGARPEFLVNPYSGERLELDRYYPVDRVAFEFNGAQHYRASKSYSKKQVEAQRRRDAVKRAMCKERRIELVVVRAEDLTLRGMLEKVGTLLPKRNLRGFRETISRLKVWSSGYISKAAPKNAITEL